MKREARVIVSFVHTRIVVHLYTDRGGKTRFLSFDCSTPRAFVCPRVFAVDRENREFFATTQKAQKTSGA